MKKLCLIFCLLLILTNTTIVVADKDTPEEIQSTTLEGLQFIKNIISVNPGKWDIPDIKKLHNATVGKGIAVKKLDSEKISNSTESILENSFLTGEWRFTIYIDEKPKFFMFIGEVKGEYKVTRFGQSEYDLEKQIINFKDIINTSKDPSYVRIGVSEYIVGIEDNIEKVFYLNNRFIEKDKDESKILIHDIVESRYIIKDLLKIAEMLRVGKTLEIPLGLGLTGISQVPQKISNYYNAKYKFELCPQ